MSVRNRIKTFLLSYTFVFGGWGILLFILAGKNFLCPHRLLSFTTYYEAALHWIQGSALYDYRQDIAGFVYSPAAAMSMIPLTIFSPFVARTLWQIFLAEKLLLPEDCGATILSREEIG